MKCLRLAKAPDKPILICKQKYRHFPLFSTKKKKKKKKIYICYMTDSKGLPWLAETDWNSFFFFHKSSCLLKWATAY